MQELWEAYSQLNKGTPRLLNNEKRQLVELASSAEWKLFLKMLDNWKGNLIQHTLATGQTKEDLVSLKAQCKCIAVLKTFHKAYNIKTEKFTDQNKELEVPL